MTNRMGIYALILRHFLSFKVAVCSLSHVAAGEKKSLLSPAPCCRHSTFTAMLIASK